MVDLTKPPTDDLPDPYRWEVVDGAWKLIKGEAGTTLGDIWKELEKNGVGGIWDLIQGGIGGIESSDAMSAVLTMLGMNQGWFESDPPKIGYQGKVERQLALREQVPIDYEQDRLPGAYGQRYFTDTMFTDKEGAADTQAILDEQKDLIAQLNDAHGDEIRPLLERISQLYNDYRLASLAEELPPEEQPVDPNNPDPNNPNPPPGGGTTPPPNGGGDHEPWEPGSDEYNNFNTGSGGLSVGGMYGNPGYSAPAPVYNSVTGRYDAQPIIWTGEGPETSAGRQAYVDHVNGQLGGNFGADQIKFDNSAFGIFGPQSMDYSQADWAGIIAANPDQWDFGLAEGGPVVPYASGGISTLRAPTGEIGPPLDWQNAKPMPMPTMSPDKLSGIRELIKGLGSKMPRDISWDQMENLPEQRLSIPGGERTTPFTPPPEQRLSIPGGERTTPYVSDGMSDSIPASIDNQQPAALSEGEFVIPADVVSGLGNGSTNAGTRRLYEMLQAVRKSRTGNPEQANEIDAGQLLRRG